jgi:ubiquinone biosynthesis protein
MLLLNIVKRLWEIIVVLQENKLPKIIFLYFFKKKTNINICPTNIYLAINKLGPLFIKIGQIISTRDNLIPIRYVEKLKKLYDSTVPFKSTLIKNTIQKNYNMKLEYIFKNFSNTPIAAASITQIHTCLLVKEKKKVVIKVICKHTRDIIKIDIILLNVITQILTLFTKLQTTKKIKNIVEELHKVITKEQDLRVEAANAHIIKKNLKPYNVLIPHIFWSYVNADIVIAEHITGIPLHKLDKIKKHKIKLDIIAKQYIELFFLQVFTQRFQADMHPGNILITKRKNNVITLVLLDFGITGILNNKNKVYMLENILAFVNGNYKKIAELHKKENTIHKNILTTEVETVLCYTWEPILNKKSKDIPFTELGKNLIEISKKFNLVLKPQLLLFQKTLITVEGVSRSLDPDINLWAIIKPLISVELVKNILTTSKLYRYILKK